MEYHRLNFLVIKFGDNDFGNTFIPLLEHIGPTINEGLMSLEQLLIIINELSFGFYLLHQNQFRYGDDMEKIKKYLRITSDMIFLNPTPIPKDKNYSWFYWDGYRAGAL